MKSCFLFGHADCPDTISEALEEAIERQYLEHNIRCFYVGHRGHFDSMAAAAVKGVKQHYPDIMLYLVIAYHPAERPVCFSPGFDGSFFPPLEKVPRPYAIVQANRYMARTSDAIICYVCRIGNARNLLNYAASRKPAPFIDNLALAGFQGCRPSHP